MTRPNKGIHSSPITDSSPKLGQDDNAWNRFHIRIHCFMSMSWPAFFSIQSNFFFLLFSKITSVRMTGFIHLIIEKKAEKQRYRVEKNKKNTFCNNYRRLELNRSSFYYGLELGRARKIFDFDFFLLLGWGRHTIELWMGNGGLNKKEPQMSMNPAYAQIPTHTPFSVFGIYTFLLPCGE